MAPKEVIFESSTSLLTCSTLKHTALIFYPYEPSSIANSQYIILEHKTKKYILVSTVPFQHLDFASISASFLFRESYIFFSQPSVLYLLLQFRQLSQPTWFVQVAAASHALLEDVLSQCVIGDFR